MLHKLTKTDGNAVYIDDRKVVSVWGLVDNVKVRTDQQTEGPFKGDPASVAYELNKRRTRTVEVAK